MNTWEFIQEKLVGSRKVMLIYVLLSEGSSPGRQGFHMAVADDGSMHGSIGGGIMEHKFVEMAKAKLRASLSAKEIYRQIHDKSAPAHQSGMICSGEQTIFLYELQLKDISHIISLVASLQQNKNGTLSLSQQGIVFSDAVPVTDFSCGQQTTDEFYYQEKTGFKNHLHIVGGGHCSLALSRLMSNMDFYITVYENRDGLNTLVTNQFAHEIKMLTSYKELDKLVHAGKNVYVVIMTFGYRTDDEALRAIIGKEFRYIGLLGSTKKIDKMMDQYKTENLDSAFLDSIKSPVGINIKSETPAEIAISIGAEIIAIKNKPQ